MNIKRLLFFLLILPAFASAQYHIKGTVTDILTHKPIDNVNVFLSNAMAGAKTDVDGNFDIGNVHSGHYDLVVSIVGYVTYHQDVEISTDISDLKILLEQKNTTLSEVKIGPDADWDRKYKLFKIQFLGTSENAKSVNILNPDVLSLHYDQQKRELTASSYDFLIIENRALGYRIRYLLNDLTADYIGFNGVSLYYEGSSSFEDLPGTPAQLKKWREKRMEAYLGSEMHFLRSVIADRVAEEHFVVRRLIRTPNPDYPEKTNSKYIDKLVSKPLELKDYVRLTDQKGEYALTFNDLLYVVYSKGGSPSSTVTFVEPHIFFDDNGIILNPRSAIVEGSWGFARISGMLPVDYDPFAK